MSTSITCDGCYKTIREDQVALRGEADYIIKFANGDEMKPGEFDWCRACLSVAIEAVEASRS